MFFHSENSNDDPTWNSYDKYYMLLIEIKYFNALIDNKPFFWSAENINKKHMEKLVEMLRNNDYTTGNLLDYF